ncbi:unnamed protein product, partial [Mesorhabditis belari]|uniref:Cystinosin n=1 Tax=Mesorhabditis belari TaxID=2138241 RepID=A0AAF3FJT7_9BILA
MLVGEKKIIELQVIEYPDSSQQNKYNYELKLGKTEGLLHPEKILFSNRTTISLEIEAIKPVSQSNLAVISCKFYSKHFSDEENCGKSLNDSFIRVSILKSDLVEVLCIVVGWTYFVLWSASFYPQIWMNLRRKSVIGMDFNYVFLNVVANGSYTIFNSLMYFNRRVQTEYLMDQPYAPLPVLFNDVVFAGHALIFSLVYSLQAIIYERGSQRLHPFLWIGGVVFIFASVSLFGLCMVNLISLLQLANLFSYVKIVCMTPMYLPQLYLNYTRKSTSGFAIETIMLDFSGGVLSLMQMVFQAWNLDDWSGFVGNPVKFGLALLTMILDLGFFIQHFCLYQNRREETMKV